MAIRSAGSMATRMVLFGILLFILCLLAITIGYSSWALDRLLEHGQVTYIGSATSVATIVPTFGNVATPWLAFASLLAGVVGLAAVFLGLIHAVLGNNRSLSAAYSATMIAWLLSLLAMGLAFKEIHLKGHKNHRLRTLEAIVIILPWMLLLPLTALFTNMMIKKERTHTPGVGYGHTPGYGAGHQSEFGRTMV